MTFWCLFTDTKPITLGDDRGFFQFPNLFVIVGWTYWHVACVDTTQDHHRAMKALPRLPLNWGMCIRPGTCCLADGNDADIHSYTVFGAQE